MRFAKKASLLAALLAAATSLNVAVGQVPRQTEAVQPGEQLPPLPDPKSAAAQPASPPANAPSAITADAVIMNSRTFGIPFRVDPVGTQPAEVQLLVSRGNAEWELLDRQPPQVRQFQFKGTDDGLFWFATRTVDASGKPFPGGPMKPQLKVFIDTTKPDVTLAAEADAAGQVVAKLQMQDATPTKNVRLHYVTDVVRQWQTIDVRPLLANGEVSFTPNHDWQHLSLQAIVIDSAGNQTTASDLIQRPRIANLPPHLSATPDSRGTFMRPVSGPTNQTAVTKLAQTTPPTNPSLPGYRAEPKPTPGGFPIRGLNVQPTPTGLQILGPNNNNLPLTPAHQTNTTAAPPTTLPPPATPAQISNGFSLHGPGEVTTNTTPKEDSQPRTAAEAMRPLTEGSALVRTESNPSADEVETIPTPKSAELDTYEARRLSEMRFNEEIWGGQVPVRYSDSERFSLAYELEAIGANGAEAVELYGSTTGGKTWMLWGADPDRQTPFDIETKGEGVFGYRIVVVGRNGLASPRPLAGDVPDIVIVVDKTEPKVRISSAQYGQGDRTGSLVIGYEASDENLMKRPVSLAFSDSVEGPWTTIAAGLRNDGMYVWPADPNMPRQIYLRIDVKDQAGNVGTYILEQAIETQGLAPRARIRGFRSLSGNEPAGQDEQTATRPKATFK
jgi:hypothetical protein